MIFDFSNTTNNTGHNTTTTTPATTATTDSKPCIEIDAAVYIFPSLTIISLIGHSLILRTIWKHENLHVPSYFLIGSLCVADIICCISMTLVPIVNTIKPGAETPMMVVLVLARTSYSSMELITIFLSCSRFAAVRWPFFYQSLFVFKRTLMLVLLIWALLFVLFAATIEHGRAPFFQRRCQNFITIITSWLSVAFDIPVILYTQHKGRDIIMSPVKRTSMLHGRDAEQCSILRKRLSKNKEVAYLFVFCHVLAIPLFVLQTIMLAAGDDPDSGTLGCITMISGFIYYLQIALHPVIYFRTMQDLRAAIVRDIKRVLGIHQRNA